MYLDAPPTGSEALELSLEDETATATLRDVDIGSVTVALGEGVEAHKRVRAWYPLTDSSGNVTGQVELVTQWTHCPAHDFDPWERSAEGSHSTALSAAM